MATTDITIHASIPMPFDIREAILSLLMPRPLTEQFPGDGGESP